MTQAFKIRVAKSLSSGKASGKTTGRVRSVPSLAASRPPRGGRGDAPQRERNPWRTAFLILLAVIIGFSSGWAYMNFGPSKLQFSITDALSGNPVSDAIVSIYDHGELAARCLTQEGECSVSVAPGSYQGAIASSNYSSKQFNVNAQGTFNVYVLTLTPTFSTVVQPGSMVSPVSYIVFTDSTSFFVRNGKVGSIDLSSSSAYSALYYAVNQTGNIFVMDGTYTFPATINVKSNTLIHGTGPQTILKTGNAANLGGGMFFTGYGTFNMTFRDFLMDGNQAQQSANSEGIEIRRTTQVSVNNVVFQNFWDSGIFSFDSAPYNTTFNVRVSDSFFVNNRKYGIQLGSGDDRWLIQGNDFLGNSYAISGGNGGSIYGQNAGNVSVIGNTITNQLGTGFNSAGIHFRSCPQGGTPNTLDGPIITGNRILSSSSEGILLFSCPGSVVTSNVVSRVVFSGIYLEGSPRSIVSSNLVSFSGSGGSAGITIGSFLPSASNHTVVSGNYVTDSGTNGILVDSSNVTIQGNTVTNSSKSSGSGSNKAGILAYGVYDFILGNRVFDAQSVPTQSYGVSFLLSGGSKCVSCIAENNDLRGNAIAGATDGGTNNIIRWNIGYKTEASGNQSVTGAVTTVTITHGLVATPLLVLVTGMQTGIGLYAVTARGATTFVITFANQPGGSTWNFQWYAQTWNYP